MEENIQEKEKEIEIPTVEEPKEEEVKEANIVSDDLSIDIEMLDKFFDEQGIPEEERPKAYTTELLENIEKIEGVLTPQEIEDMQKYVKGDGRPEFMEKMLTQTNEKLTEMIKIMAILYLDKIPTLLDYQRTLQENLIDPSKIPNMSYDDISRVSANIQREISDLLRFSLDVTKSLSNTNAIPTKVEKLANALMNVPESTRQRIEEIIEQEK